MSSVLKERISAFKPNKGGKGSVCVIGGSFEYSGAPYFAAISALRTGADLSFVVCDKEAANVIKSYSPELIVFGLLDRNHLENNPYFPEQISNRVSAIIVGTGLSRDQVIHKQVLSLLIGNSNIYEIPIIFDGDGICLYKNNQKMIEERFNKIILTPNANEYKLIYNLNLSKCVLYSKGEIDRIISVTFELELDEQGSPRRCGGIGDVLSGVIAAIISMNGNTFSIDTNEIIMCLKFGGQIVRRSSKIAFEKKRRSMSAIDVIENLGIAFEQILQ